MLLARQIGESHSHIFINFAKYFVLPKYFRCDIELIKIRILIVIMPKDFFVDSL